MLRTVDEVCDFIAEWCGRDANCPGPPLDVDFAVPECVVRLNARIGELWTSARRLPEPVLRYATPFLGLLGGQDDILNPRDYVRSQKGIVPLVWENQGVWACGFDPDSVDQLVVSGDWSDSIRTEFRKDWQPIGAKPEDALVCTLLTNLCMQSNAEWDDDRRKPDSVDQILWQHPDWNDFYSFWSNETRTLIYFGGFHVTRR